MYVPVRHSSLYSYIRILAYLRSFLFSLHTYLYIRVYMYIYVCVCMNMKAVCSTHIVWTTCYSRVAS